MRLIRESLRCLAAAVVLGSAAAAAQSDKLFDLPYEMRTLDNGLRVIVVPTDYPDVVSLQIPVQTGSRNEVEAGKSGFAHFFEHMMFRGTENYSPEEYGRILKNAGADQNAYTTDDYTNYHINFTKEDLETILKLEADRFRNLSYSEDVFRTEALAVKGEYLKNYSNPIQKLLERVRDMAFERHPYQHTTMGFLEDIEDMPNEIEYSREFFDRWYRPEYTSVIVAGDVDVERTFDLVEKYWGDWERGDYQTEIPAEPPPEQSTYEHIHWEAPTQPWIAAAWRGPAFEPGDKALSAMGLAGELYFGQTSDLYKDLVLDKQWVDQLFYYFPQRKDPQLLYFAMRLNEPERAGDAYARLLDTLARLRTELVDADRLADLKSNQRYGFANNLSSSESIASTLAQYVHYERTPETINEYFATLNAVQPEDVRRYANEFFTDVGLTLVTLSNDPEMAHFDPALSVDERAASMSSATPAEVKVVERQSESSPLVDVSFLFNTGPAHDPEDKKGLAALTALMIASGGSESMRYSEIQKALFPLAAGFEAQVDKEMIRLAGTVHRDNLESWYDIVSGQLFTPGWREEDFTRIKTRLINAIKTDLRSNNDEELGKEVLYAELYGPEHPYGHYNLGAVSGLEAITLEDVKAFYAEHFARGNLTLGLAGGYDEAFRRKVLTDLNAFPAGGTAIELPAPLVLDGRHAVVVEKETPAVAVSFGFPIEVVRGDEDWVALWLVRSWLGEHRSSNSHLYQRIREARGMNYGDYAYIEYFPRGMYLTQPDTNLGRQQQIFQIWIRPLRSNNDAHFATRVAIYELEKLIENGLAREQFENTRNFLHKQVSLLTAGQTRQLGYALDSAYYGIPRFAEYVREGLESLTLEKVNDVIREHLQTEDIRFVFVTKNATDLRDRLANDTPSPIEYNSPKPDDLLEEDGHIQGLELKLDSVEVRPVEQYFD